MKFDQVLHLIDILWCTWIRDTVQLKKTLHKYVDECRVEAEESPGPVLTMIFRIFLRITINSKKNLS